ncbi:hypothetical protein HYU40_05060 [Candidatus Woesearchaeota archaeon]|nr:hypothetical protein [Candidatus Woesearchaeota archaeon]
MFATGENRVKCGKCGSEFDLNKNSDGCPLCGFGPNGINSQSVSKELNYLTIPPQIKVPSGQIVLDDLTRSVGLWGMFNDFFSGKALLRISANLLYTQKVEYVPLTKLIGESKKIIKRYELSKLKGFPKDLDDNFSIRRLVTHFLDGFRNLGLFEVHLEKGAQKKNIWNEDWDKILVRPTSQGLEFARLKNNIFDNLDKNQVLTPEEKIWLLNYLKSIDRQGFKEYTLLSDVYSFIKKGNNGKDDLWKWFENNPKFVAYVKKVSSKTNDPVEFKKQLSNLATTFSSGKISLLRELGLVKNERNDYSIIGRM